MIERSFDAEFLLPMAVSLAFGVLFATFITLILVPTEYVILDDISRGFDRLFGRDVQVADRPALTDTPVLDGIRREDSVEAAS